MKTFDFSFIRVSDTLCNPFVIFKMTPTCELTFLHKRKRKLLTS